MTSTGFRSPWEGVWSLDMIVNRSAVHALRKSDRRGCLRQAQRGLDLAGEFVADDARIFEIGLRALENMQIGAADAGAPQSHPRFPWSDRRFGSLDDLKFARTRAEQRSHLSGLPCAAWGFAPVGREPPQQDGSKKLDIPAFPRENPLVVYYR